MPKGTVGAASTSSRPLVPKTWGDGVMLEPSLKKDKSTAVGPLGKAMSPNSNATRSCLSAELLGIFFVPRIESSTFLDFFKAQK